MNEGEKKYKQYLLKMISDMMTGSDSEKATVIHVLACEPLERIEDYYYYLIAG